MINLPVDQSISAGQASSQCDRRNIWNYS